MTYGRQRQRHGVTKNLVEGVGGFIVGAALVVFISNLLKKRINMILKPVPHRPQGATLLRP